MVIATRVPFKPLNAFYCVFLSLALLSTEFGLVGIISSSLLIYKVHQDSNLLMDGSDICSLQGKPNGTLNVECKDSRGLFTCPGFSLDKLDKETRAEVCGIVKECTRGRYAAGGLALIFSLLQTGCTIYYISVVFVYRKSMRRTEFEERWCWFVIVNGLYLLCTLIPLTLALFFKVAYVPKHLKAKRANANGNSNSNQNAEQFSYDGNSIGIFFVSWCGINAGFCLVAILLVLYFQRIRRNPQDVLALYGVSKGINDHFLLGHTFDHNLVMVDVEDHEDESESEDEGQNKGPLVPKTKTTPKNKPVDADGFSRTSKKSKESAVAFNGGKGFLDSSLDDRSASKTGGMILGNIKPKVKHRIENPGSGSGSGENGRHKRKIGIGSSDRVSKV